MIIPIMKNKLSRLLIVSVCTFGIVIAGSAQDEAEMPERIDFVSDYVELFDEDVKTRLINALTEVQDTAGLEINVLAVETSAPLSVEDYGYAVLDSWGIDESDPEARFLLFVVAMEEGQYQLITSAGLEGVISDDTLGEISSEVIIPAITAEGLQTAIVLGIDGIINAYAQVVAPQDGGPQNSGQDVHKASGASLDLSDLVGVGLIIAALALLLFVNSLITN
jgi:uncharacterized membrane protein YgcG